MKFSMIIMVGLVTVSQAAVFQWSGNGHLYEPVSVPQTISWTDAKVAAEQAGGYLATITSAEENTFVHSLINSDLYWNGSSGPWIGGYQPEGSPEPAGNWRWVTGEAFTYTNWFTNQPNNLNGQEQSLQFGYSNKTPKWNDNDNEAAIGDNRPVVAYVVEYETYVTEPIEWSIASGGNGHLYQVIYVGGGISWTNAKKAAENAGGYLATITSADEEIWIHHLINDPAYWFESSTKSLYGPWLGGFQVPGSGEPVGEWRWVTGEAFEFTNWTPTSPDNYAIAGCGNQNCLHYVRYPPSSPFPIAGWNDQQDLCPPWVPWSYIIEYSSFVCLDLLAGDLNRDCRVNLEDFVLLASNWLRCNRNPTIYCSE